MATLIGGCGGARAVIGSSQRLMSMIGRCRTGGGCDWVHAGYMWS